MTNIQKIQTILIITGLNAFISCNSISNDTNLGNYKQTEFVPTLENPISVNKNIIYAPAFLYAWDRLKTALDSKIIVDSSNSVDYKILNKSTTYRNALEESEYEVNTEISGRTIIAKASFRKNLPFQKKLQVLDEPILFDSKKVAAFGMKDFDEKLIAFTSILYYKDDNNFILKLTPKDTQQEIILVKGLDKYQTLGNALKLTNDLIDIGKKEQAELTLGYDNYHFGENDIFSIPVINFDISTNYENIEGQRVFTKKDNELIVTQALQKTGLTLDENGAVVKSEAVVELDGAKMPSPIIKRMIFDKQFLIIIKRVDKPNPYFVMKVANAELLTTK